MTTPTQTPTDDQHRAVTSALHAARHVVCHALTLDGYQPDADELRGYDLDNATDLAMTVLEQSTGMNPTVATALQALCAALIAGTPSGAMSPDAAIARAAFARSWAGDYLVQHVTLAWVDEEDNLNTGKVAELADHIRMAYHADIPRVRSVYQARGGEMRNCPWSVSKSAFDENAHGTGTLHVDIAHAVTITANFAIDGDA